MYSSPSTHMPFTHRSIYICIYAYVHSCTYVSTSRLYMYVHAYLHIYIYTPIYIYICTRMCMRVGVYTSTQMLKTTESMLHSTCPEAAFFVESRFRRKKSRQQHTAAQSTTQSPSEVASALTGCWRVWRLVGSMRLSIS